MSGILLILLVCTIIMGIIILINQYAPLFRVKKGKFVDHEGQELWLGILGGTALLTTLLAWLWVNGVFG